MGFEIEVKIRQLRDHEVAAIKTRLSVTSDAVTKLGLVALMRKLGFEDLTCEICEGGLGNDIHRVLQTSGKLYVDDLIKWAHIERNGA